MDLIVQDALAHFAHEERLFEEKGYPAAQEHSKIHNSLTNTLGQIMTEIQATEFNREWVEKGLAIKNALMAHMLEEDTKYIDYLRTC